VAAGLLLLVAAAVALAVLAGRLLGPRLAELRQDVSREEEEPTEHHRPIIFFQSGGSAGAAVKPGWALLT